MFKKASVEKAKLRMAIAGPSGSGKTYSSLLIAYGITGDWSKVGIIDTERGSSQLYAKLGPFLVAELEPPYSPANYISAIKEAESAGIEVLIIDSLSHAWAGEGGVLDIHSQAADKNRNSFTAWREVTPLHNRLVDTMLQSSCHIIATLRTKTEYVIDENGKKIRKVGLAPIQRDGLEYEFTIFGDLSPNHLLTISKDRTGLFQDQSMVPDIEMGRKIKRYLLNVPTETKTKGAEPSESRKESSIPDQTTQPVAETEIEPETPAEPENTSEPLVEEITEEDPQEFTVIIMESPEDGYAPAVDVVRNIEVVLNLTGIEAEIIKGQVYDVKGFLEGSELQVVEIAPKTEGSSKPAEPKEMMLQVKTTSPVKKIDVKATDETELKTVAISAVDVAGNKIVIAGSCVKNMAKDKTYKIEYLDVKQVPTKTTGVPMPVYIAKSVQEVKTA